MNTRDFEALIQDAWDHRTDPIDDPRVQDHLSAHPDELEAFAAWRASVLNAASPVPNRSRRWPGIVAAAAAVAVTWWATTESTPQGGGTILSSTFEVRSQAPRHTVSWREHRVLIKSDDTFFAITEHRSTLR